MSWEDAAVMFSNFKGYGEFAKRCIISNIKKLHKAGNKGPIDDLAVAVVKLEHED
jgi:hypothetical protein